MVWGTDLSRTIWDLFGQTQSDTKHHVRLHIAWHSEVPESPADGSPTPSCTHIHSNVIASPLITHNDSHFTWYGNQEQRKHDAPVRTAFLDPNNIKVLCKFRVRRKEEIIQVVWKSLKVKEETWVTTLQGATRLLNDFRSKRSCWVTFWFYLLSLHVPRGDVDTHFPVREVAVQLLSPEQSTSSQQTALEETPRNTQTGVYKRNLVINLS